MNTYRKIIAFISVIILLCCFWFYKQEHPNKLLYTSSGKVQTSKNKPDKSKGIVPEKENNKVLIVSGALSFETKNRRLTEREKYSAFLRDHPFNNLVHCEERKKEEGENETDRPDLAWEQDFLRTMDPKLKRPTPEVLPDIIRKNHPISSSGIRINGIPGTTSTPWIERGPNNVGGRTRALVWDPNDATGKKVWAGGVTGGLWYNSDITDVNSSWNRVDDFWANLSVSSISFDPNNTQVAYAGTGEGYNVGSSIGAGIWKTTNGGSTWTQLLSTVNFSYINDISVRNESGTSVIYAAVDGLFYNGINNNFHNPQNAGLQRSTDGGATWSQVLPLIPNNTINFVPASLAIGANNRLWVGTKASPFRASDRGGGRILFSDNGISWTTSDKADTVTIASGSGRVTVACAPSDANYVYAFIENNNVLGAIHKTTNGGASWSAVAIPADADLGIPNADFTRGQAWYDQALKVDPNNANTVIIGGIDLFRTTNGGSNWTQISKWSNNNDLNVLTCSIVHADQHTIAFKPGSSSTVIFGNDGGVFYTSSLSTAGTNNVISVRNNNYNVTQFHAAAIHPTAGSSNYLAGAQDNGTQRFSTAGIYSTVTTTGGDGAYCFIDQNNPSYQISSYVHNIFYLSTDGGNTFSNLLSDSTTGSFINPACYDNNKHILYTYKSHNAIYSVANIITNPSTSTLIIPKLDTNATAFKVSPYTTSSTTMFIGTSSGKLLKVTTADVTPAVTDISGSLPSGSISCIEIGSSENELLVTFFNYGINKIWYSQNGGTTWADKSGNFPNIPARWALYNPNNRANEVILATELGIYGTTNFSNAAPTWASINNGFANVRTDMLQIRSSDNQVIAATYGRGLFSSNGFGPPIIASFSPLSAGTSATITIIGGNFTGATAVSFGGTNASSFTVTSDTSITAVIGSGASGGVSVTTPVGTAIKTGFIYCQSPTVTANGATTFCSGGSVILTSSSSTGNQWLKDGVPVNGAINPTYTVTVSGSYTVGVTSANNCFATSAGITVTMNPLPATPTITAGGTTSFCSGGNVVLTSNASIGNQWFKDNASISGATNATFTATVSGSYTVKVTNVNSCSATSTGTSITVNPLPAAPTISAGGSLVFCDTGKVILTSSAATGNQWYKGNTVIAGATSSTYSANQTGNYTVLVTNSNNCIATSAVTSVTVNVIPGKPTISRNNADLVSSSITGNQWYNDVAAIPSATAQNYRPTLSGYYKVLVTNAGCAGPLSDAYYYLVTSVINIGGSNIGSYKLLPNPATEKLLIQATNTNNKISMQIIDANGRAITHQDFIGNTSIDMKYFTQGMYFVILTDTKTKKQESKQVIKQ